MKPYKSNIEPYNPGQVHSPLELYEAQLNGIDFKVIVSFKKRFGLDKEQLAIILGVSPRTYDNLVKKKRVDQDRADRFFYIRKIFNEGVTTFFNEENLKNWLTISHPNLANKRPIELLSSINGAEAVYNEIVRTKHGVLS